MIVSVYEKKYQGTSISVFMCEVDSKEEAFFEMNRFLISNNMQSTETMVEGFKKNHPEIDDIIVYMGDARFRIWYKDRPKFMSIEEWDDYNSGRRPIYRLDDEFKNQYMAYMSDLESRKKAVIECR